MNFFTQILNFFAISLHFCLSIISIMSDTHQKVGGRFSLEEHYDNPTQPVNILV